MHNLMKLNLIMRVRNELLVDLEKERNLTDTISRHLDDLLFNDSICHIR